MATIGIWYKNFHKHVWREWFVSNTRFWELSARLFEKNFGRPTDIQSSKVSHPQQYVPLELENFQVGFGWKVSHYIRKWVPSWVAHLEDNNLLGALESKILSRIEWPFDHLQLADDKAPRYRFDTDFVWLVPMIGRDENLYNVIRLTRPSQDFVTQTELVRRMNRIFGIAGKVHYNLCSLLPRVEGLERTYGEKFLDWFLRTIIEPAGGLPITGIAPRGLVNLTQDLFSTQQMFLINYLAQRTNSIKDYEVGASLVGYWYKTQEKALWFDLFENDQHYWATIWRSLGGHPNRESATFRTPESESATAQAFPVRLHKELSPGNGKSWKRETQSIHTDGQGRSKVTKKVALNIPTGSQGLGQIEL